jgi:hypothetical protein
VTVPPEAIMAAFDLWFPQSGIPDEGWNRNVAYEAFCSGAAAERDRIRQLAEQENAHYGCSHPEDYGEPFAALLEEAP